MCQQQIEQVFGYGKIKLILVNKAAHFSYRFVTVGTQCFLSLLLGNPQSVYFLTASYGCKHFFLTWL